MAPLRVGSATALCWEARREEREGHRERGEHVVEGWHGVEVEENTSNLASRIGVEQRSRRVWKVMARLVGEGRGCGEAGWRGQWLW